MTDLTALSRLELLKKCEELGIAKYRSKNKPELISLITMKQNINQEIIQNINQDIIQNINQEANNNINKNINQEINQETTPDINQDISPNINNNPTFIEVCAGAGGLSSGLIAAGFTPLLLNDIDKKCCETLRLNHPTVNIVEGCMKSINFSQYENKVDLLVDGSPCQSMSIAGTRKGLDDPRGQLLISFVDIINTIKPKIFMIENVKGLLNHNGGKTIKGLIELLSKSGLYEVKYKLLNAVDYSVPQKRERVFIVGLLKTLNLIFTYPAKNPVKLLLRDVLANVPQSAGDTYSDKKKSYFEMIPAGGCWVDLPEEKQKEYLGGCYTSGGGKRGILRRLSMDEPSLTLLCSPSQKQTERCHPTEIRPLNIREYARIQTFPDDYKFTGSISTQYKQIGNAVPVELARRIGVELFKTLRGLGGNNQAEIDNSKKRDNIDDSDDE